MNIGFARVAPQVELLDQLRQGGRPRLAVAAQGAHEALRGDAVQGRGQQVVFRAHVEQARDRAGRVVGVQGRKDQMAGQGRLDRDLGGLDVADLADHHDVGVLAQDRPQDIGEGKADAGLDLDLIDSVQLIFDRVLDGQDLLVRTIQSDQGGIERRCLAASGRAGDQDDAVRQLEDLHQGFQRVIADAQGGEVQRHALAVEHAHDHALAVHGRDRRHAQIDRRAADRQLDVYTESAGSTGFVELVQSTYTLLPDAAPPTLEKFERLSLEEAEPITHAVSFAAQPAAL